MWKLLSRTDPGFHFAKLGIEIMLRLKVKDDLDATITGWVTVMKIKNDEEFRNGDNQ